MWEEKVLTQSRGDRGNTAEEMLAGKDREHPVKGWHLPGGGVSNDRPQGSSEP